MLKACVETEKGARFTRPINWLCVSMLSVKLLKLVCNDNVPEMRDDRAPWRRAAFDSWHVGARRAALHVANSHYHR